MASLQRRPALTAELHLQVTGVDHPGPELARHYNESLAVLAIAEALRCPTVAVSSLTDVLVQVTCKHDDGMHEILSYDSTVTRLVLSALCGPIELNFLAPQLNVTKSWHSWQCSPAWSDSRGRPSDG